jgi:AraC-like DNA-binding protein
MPNATIVFEGPGLSLGTLRCEPDDETWGEDALITHPIVAFPLSPAWVVRDRSERQLVNANHVVVHQAGDEYRREPFRAGGYRCLFVDADRALIREIAEEFDPAAWGVDVATYRVPVGLTALDPPTFAHCRRLADSAGRRPDPDGSAVHAVFGLLRAVVRAACAGREGRARRGPRPATGRAHAAVVEDAKDAITSRFTERVTVHDVAAAVHVSPYHLSRVFRGRTGFAPHEYVDQLRVRTALDRILEGHDDLAALAAELGFAGPSHLGANFRRAFGVPPSQARTSVARRPANRARS